MMKHRGILSIISIVIIALTIVSAARAAVIYVDDDAAGQNDGSTWENAFVFLQDALALATEGDEIRVAQGIYKPDQSRNTPQGTGDRGVYFGLKNGVSVQGGYAGNGTFNPDARDITRFVSTLSGKIGTLRSRADSSIRVVGALRVGASAILEGFTVTGRRGLENAQADPTIRYCNFQRNLATGIVSVQSNPTLIACRFYENYGGEKYGGAIYSENGSPIVDRCWFEENFEAHGGAIYLVGQGEKKAMITNSFFVGNKGTLRGFGIFVGQCDLDVTNCVFSGNAGRFDYADTTNQAGGAIYYEAGSDLRITNCTFFGNRSGFGGAIFGADETSSLVLQNCILWGNAASEFGPQIYLENTDLTITHSIVQGGQGGIGMKGSAGIDWRQGNQSGDPKMVDPNGPDNVPGTPDDDLRLSAESPALDAGDNRLLPSLFSTDIAGRPRFLDALETPDTGTGQSPIVDMGAYEGRENNPLPVLSTRSISIEEGHSTEFTVALEQAPVRTTEVRVVHTSGDANISIVEPANGILEFRPADYAVPQTVSIAALPDHDYLDTAANIQVRTPGYLSSGVTVVSRDNSPVPRILYVDSRAPGNQSARNWDHAIHDLQAALTIARENPEVAEIRVATGTYYPVSITEDHSKWNRNRTFRPANGLALRGAYAGYGAPDPNQRDLQAFATILSADVSRNDPALSDPKLMRWDDLRLSDNTYRIFDCRSLDRSAIIDGFTITNGNAERSIGAGIVIFHGASPTISNCLISGNTGRWGGGLYIAGSPLITNTTIRGNTAYTAGGGVYHDGGAPVFLNCAIEGNQSGQGGGLYVDTSGRISILRREIPTPPGPMTLTHCVVSNNEGIQPGSGISMHGSEVHLSNSIVWGNQGHQVYVDTNELDRRASIAELLISHSNVASGLAGIKKDQLSTVAWGRGNIEADPLFTDSLGPDRISGTRDDDLHLRLDSPCIDAGINLVDMDAHMVVIEPALGVDADLNLRQYTISGGTPRVDMGPYEYGSQTIPAVLFVDAGATGSGTGISWPDAFPDLRNALLTASVSLGRVKEIHVAAGSYTPAPGYGEPDASFQLLMGVTIYGGFPRGGGTMAERDPYRHPTILSGDLQGNDGADWSGYEENSAHVVTGSNTDASAVLDGFVIRGGHAEEGYGAGLYSEYGSPTLRHCVFKHNRASEAGSAIAVLHSSITVVDCVVQDNHDSDVYLRNSSITIPDPSSTLILAASELHADLGALEGSGTLKLDTDSRLYLQDTVVRGHIQGPGMIRVAPDAELILESQATVDLGGKDGTQGQVDCEGLLHLRGESILTDANVYVHRASVEDDAIMVNCVVNAEAGAPYGQFFIEGRAGLALDLLWADGDRYLDLDPRVYDVNHIQIGAIQVDITEGVAGTQGGLFELRGMDLNLTDDCDEFLCQYHPIPAFGPSTWTLERLELKPGAKLNLTNRFDFQAPYDEGGAHEALYVRHLILGPDSVFNTGFYRVYYEDLSMDPTAQIVNIPLLGFSLNNISFDDENDYITRITHNNLEAAYPNQSRAHVQRILGRAPDPNGLMQMCNLRDRDPLSPSYNKVVPAQAQALFARSSEEEILIRFEYLWQHAPEGAELVIYLTDAPELLSFSDPIWPMHYVEVARVSPPPAGYPGAVDSGEFGVFQRLVSKGHLDFVRGTRVEFRLTGAGTCLWINNWDPGIRCIGYCGDVAGPEGQVNVIDFLAAMSECGHAVEEIGTLPGAEGYCLDGFFSTDGMISHHDALAIDFMDWQGALECLKPLESSSVPADSTDTVSKSQDLGSGQASSTAITLDPNSPHSLLILGKRYQSQSHNYLSEGLFGLDRQSWRVSQTHAFDTRLNTKLIRDPQGRIYALNLEAGLIRLGDYPHTVVGPRVFTRDQDQIYVGYHETRDGKFSPPFLDAAFDQSGHLYVVPVTIVPDHGSPHQGAARLRLDATDNYDLEMLYPVLVPGVTIQGLRELALDKQGHLIVSNVDKIRKNDCLWIFDTESGQGLGRLPLTGPGLSTGIPAPTALHFSESSDVLYLASGLNAPDAQTTTLYGLSLSEILAFLSEGQGSHPNIVRELIIQGLGQITDITEDPQSNTLWMTGFSRPQIPSAQEIPSSSTRAPFYLPCVAEIPAHQNDSPIEAQALSDYGPDVKHDLALPLSVLWQP